MKEQLIRSGYSAAKIEVLHLPAPDQMELVALDVRSTPRFLFLGRLVEQKGCAWLLDAAARVKSDIAIDIAGDGPLLPSLQNRATRLGLGDRVQFHGWVDAARAAELLAAARAVVFPSLWPEPAGLVTLESAAAGRAAIVSDIGGIPEYAKPAGHAILVAPGDVAALAAAIEKLGSDLELASSLGRAGRLGAARHFAMADHLTSLTTLYDRVIHSVRQTS